VAGTGQFHPLRFFWLKIMIEYLSVKSYWMVSSYSVILLGVINS